MTDLRGRGSPTLHDVAQAAGVSLATASRVLNGSTRAVAESNRARVEAAARLLGYSANLSAQATARGTSSIVALLVADIADPYFAQIAAGVARGADEAGLVVTVAMTERDAGKELRLVRTLRGQRPRGMILAASRSVHGDEDALRAEAQAVTAAGGRVVLLGTGDTEYARGVPVDNRGGAAALGAALAGRGYRRAVVIAADEGVSTSDDRVEGFRTGFLAGGGRVDPVARAGFSRDAGYDAASALLDDLAPGTVVFGVSDVVAIGAMSAVRDAGRSVGADIAVAGFDDIATGRDITPALTTVRLPLEELGLRALRAAVDEEWDPGADPLPLEVALRDSTPAR